ncbi:MAG: proline dehydrogenase family protein [Solirubrobacterales bacterium]|nr:proline dehydrogenase family protein [Solirubrobacterales bacterium]
MELPVPAEADVLAIGRALAGAMPSAARRPFAALDDKAMALASQDAELKAALFRFVDVVPACRSVDDLATHLAGFLSEVEEQPIALAQAMRLAGSKGGRAALGAASARGVKHMAHRFIVGESPQKATGVLASLWKDGVTSTVDLLGEATVTAAEADAYAARCAEAISVMTSAAERWPARSAIEHDSAGVLPRANLSVKVSALTPLLRAEAPELGLRDAAPRLRALLRQAKEQGAHLHIDMESYDSREATVELVLELLAEPEFADGPSAGVVLQAYLRDSPEQADRLIKWVRTTTRAHPLVVRLVKGAYWDHEVVDARQHGWSPPVFEVKSDSDKNFEHLTRVLLGARRTGAGIRTAVASHNLRSIAHAVAVSREAGYPDEDLELQILRGLGDGLGTALAARGLRVRAYCPVGDLVAGMAYLVRRLLENTSNDSFLHDQGAGVPLERLLAAPGAAV